MFETVHLCALQTLSTPCLSQATSVMTRPVRARSSVPGAVWVCVVSLWFPAPEPLILVSQAVQGTSSALMHVQTRNMSHLCPCGGWGVEYFKEHHKMLFIKMQSAKWHHLPRVVVNWKIQTCISCDIYCASFLLLLRLLSSSLASGLCSFLHKLCF